MTPYFTQQIPPAFVAALPPTVDHGELAGSGGYQSPCTATAARRTSLTTPASQSTIRSSASIRSTERMSSSESTRQRSSAFAPPDRPVPAPRGTILHVVLGRDPDHRRDLLGRRGAHDGQRRHERRPLGVVVGVPGERLLVGEQPAAG